jgi:hypothetical protein
LLPLRMENLCKAIKLSLHRGMDSYLRRDSPLAPPSEKMKPIAWKSIAWKPKEETSDTRHDLKRDVEVDVRLH